MDRQLKLLRRLEQTSANTDQLREHLELTQGTHIYQFIWQALKGGLIQRAKKPNEKCQRGRPFHYYELTEKGHAELRLQESQERIQSLRRKLNALIRAGKAAEVLETYELIQAEQKRLGMIPLPREKILESFAELVDKLGPNEIVLIETVNGQPNCTRFFKPFYVVKHEKGPPKRTMIEKTENGYEKAMEMWRKRVPSKSLS